MSGTSKPTKNCLSSYGREIDLEAAFRDAKRLLMPGHIANPSRRGGVPGDTDDWRLARAQWHYDYGNRAMAERELKDINMFRRSRELDGRAGYEPMDLQR